MRWHGGKFRIADWIIKFFPKHHAYTEGYGGGGSVLICKEPARSEVYNDLNRTMVSLFRILQDRDPDGNPLPGAAAELIRLLNITPFAREEFELAYQVADCPIEAARRTLIRSFMGYGSDGTCGIYKTGFRATVTSTWKLPATEWATYPAALQLLVPRMRKVVIENTNAIELIKRMDAPHTLHYVDPPYLPSTRSAGSRRRGAGFHVYEHELTYEEHVELLEELDRLEGMVVLSGYPSELYDSRLADWRRVQRKAYADGGRARTEVLYINQAAVAALEHGPLFA